jgi:hypothetical protein
MTVAARVWGTQGVVLPHMVPLQSVGSQQAKSSTHGTKECVQNTDL